MDNKQIEKELKQKNNLMIMTLENMFKSYYNFVKSFDKKELIRFKELIDDSWYHWAGLFDKMQMDLGELIYTKMSTKEIVRMVHSATERHNMYSRWDRNQKIVIGILNTELEERRQKGEKIKEII